MAVGLGIEDGDGLGIEGRGDKLLETVGDVCPANILACCNACYEAWFTQFDCGTGDWKTPVSGGKGCFGSDTLGVINTWLSWGGSSCLRYFVRRCDDVPVCLLGSTDCDDATCGTAPSPPADDVTDLCCGGGAPCPCAGGTPCGSCPDGNPPAYNVALFGLKSSPKCSFNTVAPFEVWKIDVSALAGNSYNVTQVSACLYSVAVPAKVLECDGDGSGCGACTPNTDVTTDATLYIDLSAGGAAYIVINYTYSGGAAAVEIAIGVAACCSPLGHLTDLTDNSGLEPWYGLIAGKSIITIPSC